MCTLWIIKNLAKLQGKVMCKCSYLNEEELMKTRKKKLVFPPSGSSSQVTTPTKHKSSHSSSTTSQREISTTFLSSSSPKKSQSQTLEGRLSTAWIAKDEAVRTTGTTTTTTTTPRVLLPQLKRGKLKRRVTIGSTLSASSGSGDAEEPADWPPFADEDYIVFCFEEDGAFHVMEDSPKVQCEEHGEVRSSCSDENKEVNHLKLENRRDCLLPNKEWLEAEEDMNSTQLSPKLNQDGINIRDHLFANSKIIMLGNELSESMECRNGSVESIDSSNQLETEEQFQDEHEPEFEQPLFPWSLISDDSIIDEKYSVSEEEMTLSLNSKLGVMISVDELLKGDDDEWGIESDQSSGFSGSDERGDEDDDQLEENDELVSESAKSSVSNQSNSSSDSFEFPLLELEYIGSPVAWPRPERVHSRKHRPKPPRPACIRCCKF